MERLTSSPTLPAASAPRLDSGGPDAADVPLDQGRDKAAADLDAACEINVGRLEHGVGRLDHADQARGFDHAQGIAVARACRYH